MRVLLIRNAYRHDFGGGERFPVHLASELEAAEHEAIVVSRQPRLLDYAADNNIQAIKGWWWSRQNWTGWRIVLFPIYLLWQIILTFWYIGTIIAANVDVVHPQSRDDFIAATLAGRLLGKRVVWTDHADLKHIYRNHQTWYKNPVGKLVYACSKLAHTVTLVSRSEAHLIGVSLGHKPPINYTVIHNGVKDTPVKSVIRDENDQSAVIFCATSRLVVDKGIGELIEAFESVKSDDVRLWLVGDGPDETKFKQLADGDQRIKFLGHQNQPLAYLAAADVFVHPTHHEGFSISIVEATMLGKPLIVTNVGGNPEIANQTNALLVEPKNVQALRTALTTLAADSNLRERLASASRQTYMDGFQFDKLVKERFLPLYDTKED